jgi:putative peptidoglycan lipid II flippase
MTTASGLLSAFSRISVFTALSRVLGFTRDIILAAVLGIGPVSDAFFVAFKLPNLFRRLTAEGAMTSAFIPGYTGVEQSEGKTAAQHLAGEIQSLLVWVLLLILVVFELFMPYVITAMAPGFAFDGDISRFDGAIHLARLTMPYLPMVSLLALWIAIGNVYGRFALGASVPVIMNLVMISGALLAWFMWPDLDQDGVGYERAGIIALSVATGGVIKLLIIGTMLWRMKSLPPIYFFPRLSPNSRTVWRRFWPAAIGSAGTQIGKCFVVALSLGCWRRVRLWQASWLFQMI